MMLKLRNQRTGFTLIEVMILSVVSLMLLGLLARFFIVAARRTEDSRLRVDIQQSAVFMLKKFERDTKFTSSRGLTAALGTHYVVSLTPVETWGSDGTAQWKPETVLYAFDATNKRLTREVYTLPEPAFSDPVNQRRAFVPTPTDLETLSTNISGKEIILSEYVEDFSLQDRSGSTTVFRSQPLKLTLKLRRPLSTSERFAEFTVHRRFALRNSF